MGADLAHGRLAEADLAVTAGKMPSDQREDSSTTDDGCRNGRQGKVVDGDLRDNAVGDAGDGTVMLEASQQRTVWRGSHVCEVELERGAVQFGRGREMRKAGTEYHRPAQRDDRHHHADKGAAHRH